MANTTQWHQSLDSCPLFQGLSVSERAEIAGLLETRSFSAGDVMVQEGDERQVLGILLSGHVTVSKKLKSGRKQELARLETNDVFGEISFFHPGPHSATVTADSAVDVALLSRSRFDLLLRVASVAAYKMAFNSIRVLAERLRHMDELAGNLEASADNHPQREEWREFQSKMYSGWKF